MACQQYFGTATKGNRIKWRICISLFLVGLALLIAFSVVRAQEYKMLMGARTLLHREAVVASLLSCQCRSPLLL